MEQCLAEDIDRGSLRFVEWLRVTDDLAGVDDRQPQRAGLGLGDEEAFTVARGSDGVLRDRGNDSLGRRVPDLHLDCERQFSVRVDRSLDINDSRVL